MPVSARSCHLGCERETHRQLLNSECQGVQEPGREATDWAHLPMVVLAGNGVGGFVMSWAAALELE